MRPPASLPATGRAGGRGASMVTAKPAGVSAGVSAPPQPCDIGYTFHGLPPGRGTARDAGSDAGPGARVPPPPTPFHARGVPPGDDPHSRSIVPNSPQTVARPT